MNLNSLFLKAIFLVGTGVCLQAFATSTTTYRCENGKSVSYADHPCANAPASTQSLVKVDPANPTDADKNSALHRAAQNKAELKKIEGDQEKERKQSSAQQKKRQEQKLVESRQCDKLQLKVKHLKEDVASASAKDNVKKHTQLRRAEENAVADCGHS